MKQYHPVILASGSPRRRQLLVETGIKFDVVLKDVDEQYPGSLPPADVALYLAQKKSQAYDHEVQEGNWVNTADTVVCIDQHILNKPNDTEDAYKMLQLLSGKAHRVITAVCLRSKSVNDCFQVETRVFFKSLSASEIRYYIELCKPFDKAGSYGIQEWLGLTGIEKIDGSYFNVVGLPVKELYEKLIYHNVISL